MQTRDAWTQHQALQCGLAEENCQIKKCSRRHEVLMGITAEKAQESCDASSPPPAPHLLFRHLPCQHLVGLGDGREQALEPLQQHCAAKQCDGTPHKQQPHSPLVHLLLLGEGPRRVERCGGSYGLQNIAQAQLENPQLKSSALRRSKPAERPQKPVCVCLSREHFSDRSWAVDATQLGSVDRRCRRDAAFSG